MSRLNVNGRPCQHCGRMGLRVRARGLCSRCWDQHRGGYARTRAPSLAAALAALPRCLHCGVGAATRSRGLCSACYRSPGLRRRYPARSGAWLEYLGDDGYRGPPGEPTAAAPGSAAKMEAMHARLRRGEGLFHEADARADLS